MSFTKNIYNEGIAAEHPDIEDQKEFQRKADEIIEARKKRRAQKSGPQLPGFIKTVRMQQTEAKDHEHSMARSEIHKIDNAIKTLRKKVKGEGNLEAWVQSKITRAADYLDAVSNYLDSGEHNHVEESFDDNVPELRSRTVTNAPSSTSSSTKKRKSPGELMRMLNQANPPTTEPEPKKKKKKKKLKEETMTPEQKSKEEALKKKYDDSEMKQNMIDQYGKERGTQIYFAKIRKMAMEEGFIDPEDEIPTSSGKWKTKSKDPAVEEDFDYLDEAKLSRTERREQNAGKKGYDKKGNPVQRLPKKHVEKDLDLAATIEVKSKPRKDPETGRKKPVAVEPAKIDIVKDGKPVRSVSTGEFHNVKYGPGETPDFRQLRNPQRFIDTTVANKHVINKVRGSTDEPNTARGGFEKSSGEVSNRAVMKHLRNIGYNRSKGINLRPGHFTGDIPGTGSPRKKLIATLHDIKKYKPTKVMHIDDDPKNLEPLETYRKSTQGSRGKTRGPSKPKIDTELVGSFAKRGEKSKPGRTHGRVRRYSGVRNPGTVTEPRTTQQNQRARKRAKRGMVSSSYDYLDIVYDFILEQLILENIAEDYDDASLILEELDDELLEDLIAMSQNFIQTTLEEDLQMTEEKELKIDYQSPYKKIQEKREIKKDYLQEEVELTPYEYWKSFIGDTEEEIVSEEIEETEELVEEVEMTSYEKWKQFLA